MHDDDELETWIPEQRTQLHPGDIVLANGEPMFVISIEGAESLILTPETIIKFAER